MHRIEVSAQLGALSLSVKTQFCNEMVVLSGDNGAGKSTLLRGISGLQQVVGQIHIDQEIWLDSSVNFHLPTARRSVGFMWSEAVLLPWLSVEGNIKLGALPLEKEWFDRLVQLLEIHFLLKRMPSMLSTGEAQRVGLARAIYCKPSILLLDEPFSAQAPELRHRLRRVLRKLQLELNIAVILVSHDAEDARVLADQHWRMRQGKLLVEVAGEINTSELRQCI
ncbi:MAG: ATP-binding cassette domain-containing protein [Mariprofundaceae bacterium]